jgi:hypothetical protein
MMNGLEGEAVVYYVLKCMCSLYFVLHTELLS